MNTTRNATLVDAGPLIAALSPPDADHARCKRFFSHFKGRLVTTWAVVAEASHMLAPIQIAQLALLAWIDRGALEVAHIERDAVAALMAYTEKYRDRPMDLADATLVVLAQLSGAREIISIDSDFDIYRLGRRDKLRNLLA